MLFATRVKQLEAENQQLRNEIAALKGGAKDEPSKQPAPASSSSERSTRGMHPDAVRRQQEEPPRKLTGKALTASVFQRAIDRKTKGGHNA